MIKRPAWTASENVEKVGEIEPHLTAKDTKKTQRTLAAFPGSRLILSVCGIAESTRADGKLLKLRNTDGYLKRFR
jgi:hypothetical protein